MDGKAGSRNNEVKMSLEALTGEMDRAACIINNGKKAGWTEQIDKNILPENLLMAKKENRLRNLIEETYNDTIKINNNSYQVREYILDWLFMTGSYLIMQGIGEEEQAVYYEAMNYTKTL